MRSYHPIKTVPASAREPYGTIAASPNGAAKPSPESAARSWTRSSPATHLRERNGRAGSCASSSSKRSLGISSRKRWSASRFSAASRGTDPRFDGVVRVEAVKLRSRLKEYCETEGDADPVRIDLPKGGYLPCFEALPSQPVEPIEKVAAPPPRRVWWTDWRLIAPPLALAVLIAGYLLARRSHPRPVTPDSSSIAVLPFVNLSSNKENEYFSDGLTDDLINALTKVRGLRVVARGSAFQFKGKNPDIRALGRQLNVAAVLEGSVQRSGNRLRITAQLSSVADGYHVWSESYDRRLELTVHSLNYMLWNNDFSEGNECAKSF